jgi:hypothetical protein
MWCGEAYSYEAPATSSLLGPNILSTLFLHTDLTTAIEDSNYFKFFAWIRERNTQKKQRNY